MQHEYEIAVSQNTHVERVRNTETERRKFGALISTAIRAWRSDRLEKYLSDLPGLWKNLSNSPPESDDSDTWRNAPHESTDSYDSPTDEDLCSREETADRTGKISDDICTDKQSHTTERKKLPVRLLEANTPLIRTPCTADTGSCNSKTGMITLYFEWLIFFS